MKISFNIGKEDYIGDYLSEYHLMRVGKRKSLTEIIEERASDKEDKTSFFIKYKETCIYRYVNEIIDADFVFHLKFVDILNKGYLKRISKEEFEKIKKIGLKYVNTDRYSYDFALLVIYAKLMCFQDRKEYLQKLYLLLHDEDRRDIINFFSLAAKGKVDINNIELNYSELIKDEKLNRDRPEKRKLFIHSSVIMKMMLYEFAKKYFNVFKKIDIEATETYTTEVDGVESEREYNYPIEYMIDDLNKNTIQVETFASSKIDFDTTRVAELLELYFKFITDINILKGEGHKFKIYGLIGNLLAIADYESYEEYKNIFPDNTYKNENNYYYKRLIKLWKA